jgi:hypothetical protein
MLKWPCWQIETGHLAAEEPSCAGHAEDDGDRDDEHEPRHGLAEECCGQGEAEEKQLADGGWNCEAANGSTQSSFNSTISVLEALLEHERAEGPQR